MPDVFGPFTTATWQQPQWFRDAPLREQAASGVWSPTDTFPAPSSGDLGLTTSGLTVTLALGRGHVRGAGYERTGTPWSATLATNTNVNPRIDRLVLRRDLSASPPTVLPVVLQGVPAATPAPPALTQNEDGVFDEPLYRMTVPGSSGTVLTGIVDERRSVTQRPGQVAHGFAAAAVSTTVFTAGVTGAFQRLTPAGLNISPVLNAGRVYELVMRGQFQAAAATNSQVSVFARAGAATVAATDTQVSLLRWLPAGTGSGARQSFRSDGRFQVAAHGTYSFAPFVLADSALLLTDHRGLLDYVIDDVGPVAAFPNTQMLT